MAAPVRIGTSGFAYREWLGSFYPRTARREELLARYAERLSAVELSATFHRLPSTATAEGWHHAANPDFRVCLTAPRHLTRELRLSKTATALMQLRKLVSALGENAGPVLFQLPSTLTADLGELEHFLANLDGLRVALELRHPSWHSDACLRLLSAHGAALAASDEIMGLPKTEVTADFVYWRLRRVEHDSDWEAWADRAALLAGRGIEVFAFLKPDRGSQAALRALAFQSRVHELLERHGPSPRSDDGPRVYH